MRFSLFTLFALVLLAVTVRAQPVTDGADIRNYGTAGSIDSIGSVEATLNPVIAAAALAAAAHTHAELAATDLVGYLLTLATAITTAVAAAVVAAGGNAATLTTALNAIIAAVTNAVATISTGDSAAIAQAIAAIATAAGNA
ncbi:hypothetical protein DFQ28_005449 [Apophysomyces sp. BC1034]|nr:hypothetical protein DFQ28_005449 [Apophysomyces sp. BC1034]